MTEEQKIYVVVAATVQPKYPGLPKRHVVQPPGRQIAQACHVVSKLRMTKDHVIVPAEMFSPEEGSQKVTMVKEFEPITTIVLQARDSAELYHNFNSLQKKKLNPAWFMDTNESAYGPGDHQTSIAVLATKKQVEGILDYLPLWQ